MLEDLWTSILEFTSQFVIPDWGGLIAMLPVAIFALVLIVIVLQVWRLARAAPAPTGRPQRGCARAGPYAAAEGAGR